MDMYQKRKMRKEKRANRELDENLSKTNINWDSPMYVPIV